MILSEQDLTQARLTLMKHLNEALTELIDKHDIEPGLWGDETVSQMADAALIVIKTTSDVNTVIERAS